MCDASQYGLGAALLQWQNDELVTLEFASKTLSKVEINWPAYEREAYAIRWAVFRFEDYIKVGNVVIVSDHKSLEWLDTASKGKVLRWSLYLQQFDLIIKHIEGHQNSIADWLSRSVPYEDPFNDESDVLIPSFIVDSDSTSLTLDRLTIPTLPTVDNIRTALTDVSINDLNDTYISNDNLRYHIRTNKLYIPPRLQESFLYWFHVTRAGFHLGINRTIRRLRCWVWWPKLAQTVSNYISSCLICIRKHTPSKLVTISGVLSRPLPFQLVSLDFVGPRDWTNGKSYYYLVIIDHASRFIVAKSTDIVPTALWLLKVFKLYWISIFATPTAILHDRGSEFKSTLFSNYILNTLRCISVTTSAYYPQGNAINESSHKSIDTMLSVCAKSYQLSFADALIHTILIYNSTPHTATGYSPFYFLHGCEPNLPGLQGFQQRQSSTDHLTYLEHLRAHNIQRQLLKENPHLELVRKTQVKLNDWVVYLLPDYKENIKQDLISKFSHRWSLPAKIIAIKNNQITVENWGNKRQVEIPISRIKHLQGNVPFSLQKINLKELHIKTSRDIDSDIKESKSTITWTEFLKGASKHSKQYEEKAVSKKRKL